MSTNNRLEQVKKDIALLEEEEKRLKEEERKSKYPNLKVPVHRPPFDFTDSPDAYYFQVKKTSIGSFWINTGYYKTPGQSMCIDREALEKIKEAINICLDEKGL